MTLIRYGTSNTFAHVPRRVNQPVKPLAAVSQRRFNDPGIKVEHALRLLAQGIRKVGGRICETAAQHDLAADDLGNGHGARVRANAV